MKKLTAILSLCAALCLCPLAMANTVADEISEEGTAVETPVTGEGGEVEELPTLPEEGAPAPDNGAQEDVSDGAEEELTNGLQSLVDGFIAQLKVRYGADYEQYYEAVLAEWGSVEAYLLSLSADGKVPDVAKEGYEAFVCFLGETAPVWGSALAVLLVIIALAFGKKAIKSLAGWFDGSKKQWQTLFEETNKQCAVLRAQNAALVKLLGENPRFEAERVELEKTGDEIVK